MTFFLLLSFMSSVFLFTCFLWLSFSLVLSFIVPSISVLFRSATCFYGRCITFYSFVSTSGCLHPHSHFTVLLFLGLSCSRPFPVLSSLFFGPMTSSFNPSTFLIIHFSCACSSPFRFFLLCVSFLPAKRTG